MSARERVGDEPYELAWCSESSTTDQCTHAIMQWLVDECSSLESSL